MDSKYHDKTFEIFIFRQVKDFEILV